MPMLHQAPILGHLFPVQMNRNDPGSRMLTLLAPSAIQNEYDVSIPKGVNHRATLKHKQSVTHLYLIFLQFGIIASLLVYHGEQVWVAFTFTLSVFRSMDL